MIEHRAIPVISEINFFFGRRSWNAILIFRVCTDPWHDFIVPRKIHILPSTLFCDTLACLQFNGSSISPSLSFSICVCLSVSHQRLLSQRFPARAKPVYYSTTQEHALSPHISLSHSLLTGASKHNKVS